MARIRSIHPDALKSERLALATAEGERCYWRLQPHCDDEGRCEDAPKILAAYLFPQNEDIIGTTVDGWLAELAGLGLIERYEAGGQRVIQVRAWNEYQHPQRATPSKLPSPPVQPPADGTECTSPPEPSRPLRESSASPHEPSTLEVGDGEGDGEPLPMASAAPPQERARDRDPLFDAFAASVGHKPVTNRERGAWNSALAELRRAEATAEQVAAAVVEHRRTWPSASVTLPSLVKHWGRLTAGPPSQAPLPAGPSAHSQTCACEGTGMVETPAGYVQCDSNLDDPLALLGSFGATGCAV